jgi:hypothetical protein
MTRTIPDSPPHEGRPLRLRVSVPPTRSQLQCVYISADPRIAAPPPMPPDDARRCLDIMQKMTRNVYAFPFLHATNPMDLGTVRANIEAGAYASVADWAADMNMIWDNALEFAGPGTLAGAAAAMMRDKFERVMADFKLTAEEKWIAKITRLTAEFERNRQK